MRLATHRVFDKKFTKLNTKVQGAFFERSNLLLKNPTHPLLHNHTLRGEYEGCRSINITGDYRAIYFIKNKDTYVFINIGTHSELYS